MYSLGRIFILSGVIILGSISLSALNFHTMAKELETGSARAQRIAVLKFQFAEEPGHTLETRIQEELTYLLVKSGKFSVLERNLVNKVMEEQQLSQTGLIDSSTAQKIGKGSGAEAIVTGTIKRIDRETVKIQARMIRTDTFDIIAISQITAEDVRPPTEEEKASEMAPLMELQVYGGYSHAEMSLAFENKVSGVKSNYLTFVPLEKTWNNVGFEKLKTKDNYPAGIRFLATVKYYIFGFDIGYFAHSMDKQIVPGKFDGFETPAFNFSSEEYVTSSIIKLSVPLGLSTHARNRLRIYLGFEPGFAIANTHSDFIFSYTYDNKNSKYVSSKGLDTFSVGYYFGAFAGLNLKITEQLGIFTEARVFTLGYTFNRNINEEKDTVTLRGYQAVAGISFRL